jgi:hypothetical protein
MSWAAKAFWGAIAGALLALLVHPVSRPLLLSVFLSWGESRALASSEALLHAHKRLPVPEGDPITASLWMQAGATGLARRRELSREELVKLAEVAARQADREPQNAYWLQMAAVFQHSLGRTREAQEAWLRAGRLDRWDDYQTRRLMQALEDLRGAPTGPSWQTAALYGQRSPDAARVISSLGRELVRRASATEQPGLTVRYATVQNGRLLREGARSVYMGAIGSELIEIATYPGDLQSNSSPRRLLLARADLYNNLMAEGMEFQASQALEAFKSNDGWSAFIQEDEARAEVHQWMWAALLAGTVPSALLAVAGFGGFIWLLALFMAKQPALMRLVEPPWAPAIGVVLAVATYYFTRLPLASIAVAACFGFLAFTPARERSHPPKDLGVVFDFVLWILGAACVLLLAAFFVGASTPGWHLLRELGAPSEFYGGSALLLGLTGIVMSLILLAAPSWALVQRIATPLVVALTLRKFGRGVFRTCLALSVALMPFAIILDFHAEQRLSRIVQNEPVYHLQR